MRDVFFGWEGLATGFKGEGLVVDIGTTDPLETVEMAKDLARHNIHLVDAPAFGTPDDAREGRLTMVVGGEDKAVERCRPVLDALAAKVIRAGAAGSAQAAVAIADYVRAVRLLAASEAVGWAGISASGRAIFWTSVMPWAGRRWARCFAMRSPAAGSRLGCSSVLHANGTAERAARAAGLMLPLMTQTEAMLRSLTKTRNRMATITAP